MGRSRMALLAAIVALALGAALIVEGERGFLLVFALAAAAGVALLVSMLRRRPAERAEVRHPVPLERAPRRVVDVGGQGTVRVIDDELEAPASRLREEPRATVIHLRQRQHRPPRLERPPARQEPTPPVPPT